MADPLQKNNILPISIVIPTKNEAKYLPRLLESINAQLYKPSEIIVSDAQSTDNTRSLAAQYGAKVVEGGAVSIGRNNGAKASKEDILIFFDADVRLPKPTFLLEAYAQFLSNNLDGASTLVTADKESQSVIEKVSINVDSLATKVSQVSSQTAILSGRMIMVKRDVFNSIKGFGEDITYREDTDFVRKLHKSGYKFKILNLTVETSGRRYRSPKKLSKAVLALFLTSAVFGFLSIFFSKDIKKRILDTATKIYGALGGEDSSQSK